MSRIQLSVVFSIAWLLPPPTLAAWPVVLPTPGHFLVADVTGDGLKEVIVVNGSVHLFDHEGNLLPGWPFTVPGGHFVRPPRVGDLDGNGSMELVVTSQQGIYAIQADGTVMAGWPVTVQGGHFAHGMSALGDLDGDGGMDIVYAAGQAPMLIYALGGNGTPLPGWPVQLPWTVSSNWASIAVGDVDFDGTCEVVTGYTNYSLAGDAVSSPIYVYNGDGSVRAGWPYAPAFPSWGILRYPCIGDLDGDFQCEIFGSGVWVHGIRHDAGSLLYPPRPVFGNTGREVVAGNVDDDPALEILVPTIMGISIIDWDATASPVIEHTLAPYSRFQVLSAGDIDGDGKVEIACMSVKLNGVDQKAVHFLNSNLQEFPGWPKILPVPFGSVYSVIMDDLDADGDIEIIYNTGTEVVVWDEPIQRNGAPIPDWNSPRGSPADGAFLHRNNPPRTHLLRGDCNGDGTIDVSDVIRLVGYLFLNQTVKCREALDVNVTGTVNIADVSPLLAYVFGLFPAIDPPFPQCEDFPVPYARCQQFECP